MVVEIGAYLIFIGLLLSLICLFEAIDNKIMAKRKANRIAKMKRRKGTIKPSQNYNIIVRDVKNDIA